MNRVTAVIDQLADIGRYARMTARLMIGVPDYDAYLRHMRSQHPERRPMSYEEFFRERQDARYKNRGARGCC
jgi:uncharacterized short protein YbdD (DUF466 family)